VTAVSARSTSRQLGSFLPDTVCVLAATLAFLAFPTIAGVRSAFLVAAVFRGLWCGLVAGLALPRSSWRRAGVIAAVSATLGAVAVRFGLGSIAVWHMAVAVAIAVAVAALASLMAARKLTTVAVVIALAAVLLGLGWRVGVLPGPFAQPTKVFLAGVAKEPTGAFHFDGQSILKTIFLVKRGVPYYTAFGQSVAENPGYGTSPKQVFNYREPWPARFVALLPGNPGLDAWGTFFALVAAATIGAYLLTSQFVSPGAALLGPMLLVAYFSFPAMTKWFPLVELWGGALAVLAVVAFTRERWWAAAILVAIAVAVRELMVYLIPAGLVAWALYPKRKAARGAAIALVVLPVAVLAYHVVSALAVVGPTPSGSLSTWMHGGVESLVTALRFCSNYMPWGKLTSLGAPVLALLGAVLVPRAWRKALLVSVIGVPTVALALFSSGASGYYWGGIFQPVALAMVPLAFIPVLSLSAGARAGAASKL